MKEYQRMQTDEVIVYWQRIVSTLDQRGLLSERPRQGGKVIPEVDAILLPDRCLFVLDMQRLGGIPREKWLDENLWKQWRAALQGRRCFVSDGGGLAITVAREPGTPERKRLPALIPLTRDELPGEAYHVTLGHSKRGRVTLDLAEKHRAILTGGASGSGKTNFMQSVVLQLAAQHSADEVRFAIVDTKAVDFAGAYERLPHLFAPIARELDTAQKLIERVEQERIRRQALMADAKVSDWRDLCEPFPLLLLIVDEAADFRKTPAMETLIEIARKGRAFGVSILLGTQSPSSKVIDPQVRANLPTAIAFQARTYIESKVILGCKGAEDLRRPGQALTFIGGRWEKVQVLRVEPERVGDFISERVVVERPALDEIEAALVRHALDELDGAFTINRLYGEFKGRISRRRLVKLGRQWEQRGWLTEPRHAADPRRVTDELLALMPAAPGGANGSHDHTDHTR